MPQLLFEAEKSGRKVISYTHIYINPTDVLKVQTESTKKKLLILPDVSVISFELDIHKMYTHIYKDRNGLLECAIKFDWGSSCSSNKSSCYSITRFFAQHERKFMEKFMNSARIKWFVSEEI